MTTSGTCCIALLAATALMACQSPSPPDVSANPEAPTALAVAMPAAQTMIRGQAAFPQRLKLAPGASFQVQLIDEALIDGRLADSPAAVLAERTYRDVAGPAYVFELPYDTRKLRANGNYGVHAGLRTADGQLIFVTDPRVPYLPGKDDVGEFELTMVNGDDNGLVASTAPWDKAKARNVGFRAVGNEPGWLVEVGLGEAPGLHAELDYGDRIIDVARTQALPGNSGVAGTATDGVTVELRIQREPCSDDMSGERFLASVQLRVGDRSYRGCGRFLFE